MSKRKVKAMLAATLQGELLKPDDLRAYDIFKGVDLAPLERYPGTIARRRFKAGEVICREGEGGTTAFYLVEGRVRVFIQRKLDAQQNKNKPRRGGIIAWVGRMFGQRPIRHQPEHDADDLIPIDATVDLTYGRAAAEMGPGDVFGEMSCLNLAPRSATVVAETDCVMFEILRNMFEAMQASETFVKRMDDLYRERSLRGHLRNVPMFAEVEDEDLERLRNEVTLVHAKAGDVVFHEGDEADAMYLIRLGQVKVSQHAPGGERTLAYLTKGDWFGETGLLRGSTRNATCKAVAHPSVENVPGIKPAPIELVRIGHTEFAWLIEKYPRLRGKLEATAELRIRDQQRMAKTATITESHRVEELGLLQGQNMMLIDLDRCTRCDQCVDACVSAHDDGVTRLIREGPRYDKYLVPSSCRMCRDPVCMIGCPVGSIRRAEDLHIMIEDWCIGCEVCAKQCPYDSIQMHALDELGTDLGQEYEQLAEAGEVRQVTQQAAVCDQCADLPTGPACVYSCPHDAALRVNSVDFLEAMDVMDRDVHSGVVDE